MPANTDPLFPLTPVVKWTALTSADTTKDGTSLATVYTVGANGGRLIAVECKSKGNNAASLLRLFGSDGTGWGTASHNFMVDEVSLPAITNSETQAQPKAVIMVNKVYPAGTVFSAALATAVSAGWHIVFYGEDF